MPKDPMHVCTSVHGVSSRCLGLLRHLLDSSQSDARRGIGFFLVPLTVRCHARLRQRRARQVLVGKPTGRGAGPTPCPRPSAAHGLRASPRLSATLHTGPTTLAAEAGHTVGSQVAAQPRALADGHELGLAALFLLSPHLHARNRAATG